MNEFVDVLGIAIQHEKLHAAFVQAGALDEASARDAST